MANRRRLNFIFSQPDELRTGIQRTEGRDELYDLQESAMLDWFMRTSDTVPVGGDPRRFPSTPHIDGRPVKGDHALA